MLLPVTAALLNHSPEWKLPWNRLWVTTHNFGILWYSSLTFCLSSHIPRSCAHCLPSTYWKSTSARPTQAGCSLSTPWDVEGFIVFPEVSRKPWTWACDWEVQLWPVRPSIQNERVLADQGKSSMAVWEQADGQHPCWQQGGWNRKGDF